MRFWVNFAVISEKVSCESASGENGPVKTHVLRTISSGCHRSYSMSKWMSKIMGPYSGSGQMCASACFTKRFSQAVSWWCPLDSALYSFDRGTVVRKKNQVEHRLHGCMNFCANRGLTCKMYGDSAAKVNSHQFSVRPPERASAWIFKRFSQTVSCWCPLQSAFAAESDL